MFTSDRYTRNAHWIAVSFFGLVLIVVGYYSLLNIGYNEGYKDAQTSNGSAEANYELYKRCFGLSIREEVLNCLETNVKASRADQREEEDLQAQRDMSAWAFAVFLATSVVGALTVFITGIGVFFVRDTLKANLVAVGISQKQLIASQRPWLRIEATIADDLEFLPEGGVRIGIEITVFNIGNYPASEIAIFPCIEFIDGSVFDQNTVIDEKLKIAASLPPMMAREFLFPQDDFAEQAKVSAPRDLMKKDIKYPEAITPYIIICAAYKFDTSQDTHFSAISPQITRVDRQSIRIKGGNIPKENLYLRRLSLRRDRAT